MLLTLITKYYLHQTACRYTQPHTTLEVCSKKISMPDGAGVSSIAWDKRDGWLCCGASNGLVKVIKFEWDATGGQAGVSMFTLDGHLKSAQSVVACCWNESHKKLTTSDASGHIVVWAKQKGMWHEEMVNNREKSVVTAMKWAPDGSCICIAYKDGAVIVGSVDGTRIWGKELQMPLDKVAWNPSCQNILFTSIEGDCFVYDSDGNQICQMQLSCNAAGGRSRIAGLHWCEHHSLHHNYLILAGELQLNSSH